MDNFLKTLNRSSIVVGSAVGLAITMEDVYNIIGIIVLAFQLVLVLIQIGFKVYDSIKTKDVNKISSAIDEAKEELDNFKKENTKDDTND